MLPSTQMYNFLSVDTLCFQTEDYERANVFHKLRNVLFSCLVQSHFDITFCHVNAISIFECGAKSKRPVLVLAKKTSELSEKMSVCVR